MGLFEYSSDPNKDTYFLFLADDVGDGWAAGGSVTVNSRKHFSNEFSYFRVGPEKKFLKDRYTVGVAFTF